MMERNGIILGDPFKLKEDCLFFFIALQKIAVTNKNKIHQIKKLDK